jgi:hypothetical protein
VHNTEFACTGGIPRGFELQSLIYYKDQLLVELTLLRDDLLEVLAGVLFWRTPAKGAVALLMLVLYEMICFTGHYYLMPVGALGFAFLGVLGSYSPYTSEWPAWWYTVFDTVATRKHRVRIEHGAQQRPGVFAVLRCAVHGKVTPLKAAIVPLATLLPAAAPEVAPTAVASESTERSAKWCPCLGNRNVVSGEEEKLIHDHGDLADIDDDDDDDWKVMPPLRWHRPTLSRAGRPSWRAVQAAVPSG